MGLKELIFRAKDDRKQVGWLRSQKGDVEKEVDRLQSDDLTQ